MRFNFCIDIKHLKTSRNATTEQLLHFDCFCYSKIMIIIKNGFRITAKQLFKVYRFWVVYIWKNYKQLNIFLTEYHLENKFEGFLFNSK